MGGGILDDLIIPNSSASDIPLLGRLLGSGEYKNTYDLDTNKVIQVMGENQSITLIDIPYIKNEINAWKAAGDHPYVCTLYNIFIHDDKIYFICEKSIYGNKQCVDLRCVLQNKDTCSKQPSNWKGLFDAVKYLHDKGFTHRDIKPDNILVKNPCHFLLSDFGLANISKLTAGTTEYIPRYLYELKDKGTEYKVEYGIFHDIYSLGISIYETFHKLNSLPKIVSQIGEPIDESYKLRITPDNYEISLIEDIKQIDDNNVKTLLNDLLKYSPNLTIDTALEYKYFNIPTSQ